MKRTIILALLAGLVVAGGAYAYVCFTSDVKAAEERLTGRSKVILTRQGQLEYAVAGSGPPFLMIHGTGGGFDQGLTFTEGLRGFQVIAPSRFGYLRSHFPSDPSSEQQADAFTELLDRLKIDK